MGQYTGSHGYVELVLDWNSMLVGNQREKFSIFSAGRLNYGAFTAATMRGCTTMPAVKRSGA